MKVDLSLRDPAEAAEEIEEFIRDKLEESGRRVGVIALSGGLDSSLVATLAVRALGSERVVSHLLPDEITSAEDMEDARELARSLGISPRLIPISKAVEAFRKTFQEAAVEGDRLSWANLRPRVRMVVNYFVANSENGLVLGTGNKSELLTGYYTKHGDGGVDLLPIGHLYKTQVRQLARFLGLPEKIIHKTPSAGLWPGQTDEDEIGCSYEQLDLILHCLHDRRMSINQTVKALKLSKKLVQRVADMMRESEHKRRLPPIPG